MNPNKALWEKGDFTRIAASMRSSGEALVKSLGITRGLEVLDLGMRRWHDRDSGGAARRRSYGLKLTAPTFVSVFQLPVGRRGLSPVVRG
jgi:hypothetical protein